MLHTISDGHLKAVISEHGAELQSVTRDGKEYLYDGSSVWKERSPFLFPIVGRLRDEWYEYEGKRYEMGGHGFGRHKDFEYMGGEKNRAVFMLKDDEQTRACYPFSFEAYIIFVIENDILSVTYDVKNTNDGPMYFSIGAHDGYRCPMEEGESFTDYKLVFEKKENINAEGMVKPNTLVGPEGWKFLNDENEKDLDYSFFETDAVVLLEQKSHSLTLVSKKSGRGVEVCFPGFPMLGIWTRPNAPYLCIEPWFGVCDRYDHNHKLTEKYGIQKLEKGKCFTCTHTIRPF